MSDDKKPSSDTHSRAAYETYAIAVGGVVYSWNFLQEMFGFLFSEVLGLLPNTAFAIWYSTSNDRAQRDMLRAVVLHKAPHPRFPKARDDLLWLIDRANTLADNRNDAIHTRCDPYTDETGRADVTALTDAYLYGHPRSKKLAEREILQEFDWCQRSADVLTDFARQMAIVLAEYRRDARRRYAWPDRPSLPDRRPKKILQGQRHPPRTE
jgi:hypothetical protein